MSYRNLDFRLGRADRVVVEDSTPTPAEANAAETYVDIAPSIKNLEKKEKVGYPLSSLGGNFSLIW